MKLLASPTAPTICCWLAVWPSGAAGGVGGEQLDWANAGAPPMTVRRMSPRPSLTCMFTGTPLQFAPARGRIEAQFFWGSQYRAGQPRERTEPQTDMYSVL